MTRPATRPARRFAPLALLPLALAACGRGPAASEDLNSLDRELTETNMSGAGGTARDPALRSALAGQIMVDPGLTQTSNVNAVRPPSQPETAAIPPATIAPRTDPTNPATLKHAPAAAAPAAASCPDCTAAKGALTLGALAARQKDRRSADCARRIGYSAGWANRLPADLPLYPDARVTEAAGNARDGCALRIVSFVSNARIGRVIDFYYTKATAAGYSAQHTSEGAQHVLGGTRGNDAYVVYVSPHAGGGSDVDLVANAGR